MQKLDPLRRAGLLGLALLLVTPHTIAAWYPVLADPTPPALREPRSDTSTSSLVRARLSFTSDLPPHIYLRERGHPRFTIVLECRLHDPVTGNLHLTVQQADTRTMSEDGWMVLTPTATSPRGASIQEARIRVTTELIGRGLCFDRRLLDTTAEELADALGSIRVAHWLLEPLDGN